jgi:dCTP deaminase
MFLSHQTIAKYIASGLILIGPNFDENNIRPVGIRMHLGKYVLVPYPNQTVDLTNQVQELKYRTVDLTQEEFYLEPGQFVLGATYETLQTAPHILAILDGRSTVARLGLTTHVTASIIDGTFDAPHAATLELKNVGNFRIRLKEKDPIAMMIFAELKEPVVQKTQSQYRDTTHTVAPPNLQFKTGQDK